MSPPQSPSPPIQGYVDDVVFISMNSVDFASMFDKTEQFMNGTGMNVKQRKCGILTGKRSGNNWRVGSNINISVQNETIPIYEKNPIV